MSGARSAMRYRCTIERATKTSDGAGGHTDQWQTVTADVPCHAWYPKTATGGSVVEIGAHTYTIEPRRVIVPLGSDVKAGDRLTGIQTRRGAAVFPGPALVDIVAVRHDHLQIYSTELRLRSP